jgi:hypothetical protein
MDWSPASLLTLARFSDAAYLTDARAAVEALGGTYVAQMGGDEGQCQALLLRWGGFAVVALQGTRVEQNISLPELWDDIDGMIAALPDGTRVHAGFWDPLAAVWPQIAAAVPEGQPLLTGHSLGGVRAHLARALWPNAEVVSFGAPKGADDAFWQRHYPNTPPSRIVYERDFAPGWPWDGPWTQPAAIDWLHDGKLVEAQTRPGIAISVSDHNIDTAYIPALVALASS